MKKSKSTQDFVVINCTMHKEYAEILKNGAKTRNKIYTIVNKKCNVHSVSVKKKLIAPFL